jgi:TP901 family phage tail tape measure protein
MSEIGSIKAKLIMDSSNFKKGMSDARSEMSATSKAALNTKKSIGAISTASGSMALAVGAAMAVSVQTAANFEASMTKVKAITNASETEFARLEETAKSLGASSQYSSMEIADAMYNIGAAGFSTNQIIETMPGLLNLAAASQTSLAQASEICTSIMSGFGIEAAETARVVDVLTQASNSSNASIPDLGAAMKFVGPVAKTLGISLEETASAIGLLSNAGIKGSEAGTSLRAAMLALANPVGQGAKAIERLGIEVTNSQGKMKPLNELIGHIASKMTGMTDAQKTATAAQLVGTEAASGFLTLLDNGQKSIQDFTKELENSGGVAEKVAKVQMDTLKGSYLEFSGALESLGINIGQELLPEFRKLVDFGTSIVRVFGDMDASVLTTGAKMLGAAAGTAFLVSTIGKLSIAIKAMQFSLGPVGWLSIGLGTIAALAVNVSDNYDRMTEVTLKSADALKSQSTKLDESITKFNGLKDASTLSTEEFGRFIDIQEELNETIDPAKLEALKNEAAKLTEKSGLTNAQLTEMARLNGELVKTVPGATDKITDQGNKVLVTTGKLEKYSESLKDATMRELEIQRIRAENKQDELLKQVNKLQDELNEGKKEEARIQQEINNFDYEGQKIRIEKIKKQLETIGLSDYQREQLQGELILEEGKLEKLKEQKAKQMEKNDATQVAIDKKQVEIGKLDIIKQRMIDELLIEQKITNEKGNGIQKLDETISKLQTERANLVNNASAAEKKTVEYKEALGHLDSELAKLNGTKAAIDRVTGAQGSTNSKISDGVALAQRLNDVLSKSINKTVNITEIKRLIVQSENAAEKAGVDTSRHQGGPLPKFHSGGSPNLSGLAGPPNHHEIDVRLLRDEMILTSAQQASLFRMLDAPSAGLGGGMSDELIDILRSIDRGVRENGGGTIEVSLDGHSVASATYPYINDRLTMEAETSMRTRGFKR